MKRTDKDPQQTTPESTRDVFGVAKNLARSGAVFSRAGYNWIYTYYGLASVGGRSNVPVTIMNREGTIRREKTEEVSIKGLGPKDVTIEHLVESDTYPDVELPEGIGEVLSGIRRDEQAFRRRRARDGQQSQDAVRRSMLRRVMAGERSSDLEF